METNTTNLMNKAKDFAILDFHSGIPERHHSNSGEQLAKRCSAYGLNIRYNGDKKYLRMAYTAAYWWESMQKKREEEVEVYIQG